MTQETLSQIAKHFVEVYSEEIENNEVTPDMIAEWWGFACDQYGYSQENKDEVIDEIESKIWCISTESDKRMKQLELHIDGLNAHSDKVYYYGIDYQTKNLVFTTYDEQEAYKLVEMYGYKKKMRFAECINQYPFGGT